MQITSSPPILSNNPTRPQPENRRCRRRPRVTDNVLGPLESRFHRPISYAECLPKLASKSNIKSAPKRCPSPGGDAYAYGILYKTDELLIRSNSKLDSEGQANQDPNKTETSNPSHKSDWKSVGINKNDLHAKTPSAGGDRRLRLA
jgi:hypothetical protein